MYINFLVTIPVRSCYLPWVKVAIQRMKIAILRVFGLRLVIEIDLLRPGNPIV